MKFGAQLEAYAVPEWQGKYFPYNHLSKWLKRASKRAPYGFLSQLSSIRSFREYDDTDEDAMSRANTEFLKLVDRAVIVIEEHWAFEMAVFHDRMDGIQSESQEIERLESEEQPSKGTMGGIRTALPKFDAHRGRLQRAAMGLWICFDKLEDYKTLNFMAVGKIMKKRDKHLGYTSWNADVRPFKKRLKALQVEENYKTNLLGLYKRCLTTDEHFDDVDFTTLQAAVQRQFMRTQEVNKPSVAFVLGVSLVLFIDILVMWRLPPTNPTYDNSYVLQLFPIWRGLLCGVLAVWGGGVAVACCEAYGINYRFLFDMDPKTAIRASTLFATAALQSVVWIVGLLVFFADYKFCMLGRHNMHHFHLLLQIILQLGILAIPNNVFRGSYRWSLLCLLTDVIKGGFQLPPTVTFNHSFLGDILTSMAKPLADLFFTICFCWQLTTRRGHLVLPIETCLDNFVVPLLAAFPLWIRFLQNISRHQALKDPPTHLMANTGKYLASLLVIAVGCVQWDNVPMSIYTKRLFWVITYIVASLYNLFWDFVMDWRLIPNPDSFMRANDKTMLPQWLYYSVALVDICGRLTWAVTLLPFPTRVMADDALKLSVFFTLLIAVFEIVRRTLWSILRLECEHLTNSSKYRAMLWVPTLPPISHDTGDLVYCPTLLAPTQDGPFLGDLLPILGNRGMSATVPIGHGGRNRAQSAFTYKQDDEDMAETDSSTLSTYLLAMGAGSAMAAENDDALVKGAGASDGKNVFIPLLSSKTSSSAVGLHRFRSLSSSTHVGRIFDQEEDPNDSVSVLFRSHQSGGQVLAAIPEKDDIHSGTPVRRQSQSKENPAAIHRSEALMTQVERDKDPPVCTSLPKLGDDRTKPPGTERVAV